MCTTIEDRIVLLLNEQARIDQTKDGPQRGTLRRVVDSFTEFIQMLEPGRGYLERLTEYTSISTQRWRKVFHRRQRTTPDMIEALARLFPQYAFWIATGTTDSSNGHVAPANEHTFPERLHIEADAADRRFRRSLVPFRRVFEEAGVELKDIRARIYAAERTQPLASWYESPLVDASYRVAQSDEYAELRKMWASREEARSTNLHRIWSTCLVVRSPKDQVDKTHGCNLTAPFSGWDGLPQTCMSDLVYKAHRPKGRAALGCPMHWAGAKITVGLEIMSECLGIVCPACGTVFGEDGWEVLAENEVHQMICQACRNVFFFSWFECESCVADNLTSSLSEQDCLDRRCKKCGYHPDDIREDHEESHL